MAENTPQDPAPQETPPPPTPETGGEPKGDAAKGDDGKGGKEAVLADLAKERSERKKLQAELEQVRTANLSEAEKAVAEAEKRGEQKAAEQWSPRLVRSDFVAAASRRNPEFDAASVLDDLNLSRFIGEDGEPNADAIAKAVERLIPASGGPRLPSFDGGARTTPPASAGMNGLIRKATGRA